MPVIKNTFLRLARGLQGEGRFFRRSLAAVLVIASVPGLLIGAGIYFAGSGQIARETNRLHQEQMEKARQSIDNQLGALEISLSHWAFDPQFDEKLMRLDPVYGYKQVQDIYKTLLVMKQLNPVIRQVKLYVGEPQPLLFTEDGYTRLEEEQDAVYRDMMAGQQNQTEWSGFAPETGGRDGRQADAPLSLIHKIPGGSPRAFGMFIVTVDPDKIEELVTILTPQREGTAFLVRGDGEWIPPFGRNGQAGGLDAALRQRVLEGGREEEHFTFKWHEDAYSVSYGVLNRLGEPWIYVSATPLEALTRPFVFVSRIVLGFSCFGLLVAVVLSWVVSRRLYEPVARLVKLLGGRGHQARLDGRDEFELFERVWHDVTRESQTLQARLERQLPQVREGFLLQFAQGYLYYLSESDLRERMANLGWDAGERRYAVLFVQLLGFSSLMGRFSEGDEVLVTFAAANIAQELAAEAFEQADSINFQDLTIGLLLADAPDGPSDEWRSRVYRLLHDMTARLNQHLHMRVAVALGRPVERIKDVPATLEEARQALRFRDLREDNQIIDLSKRVKQGERQSEYPFRLEREVVRALRSGLEEETAQAVGTFLRELQASAGKELLVQQGMLHLLGAVQHAMMQTGVHLGELYGGANLYEQLCQLREPEEIERWFMAQVIAPFMREMTRKQDVFLLQAVERVVATIQERYMEELSLDALAETEGLSSYALSRTFKQAVGLNFIDYLTGVRLEKAKQLLRDTDMKLNDIAERVGYQHSYFSRIFKKHTRVTPSRYRENCRASGADADNTREGR